MTVNKKEQEATEAEAKQREKEESAERELQTMIVQVSDSNKRLDDEYDEKLKRIEAMRKLLPKDEESANQHSDKVQQLKEKYDELKAGISAVRRSGKDPFIADLISRSIPAKIKMLDVTGEQKDLNDVELSIKRAREELEEAKAEEQVNVKKEIEAKLKQDLQKETGKVTATDDD